MGTFRIDVTVSNPRDVIDMPGCEPVGVQRVRRADGREEEWAVATVSLRLLEIRSRSAWCP